MKLLFVALLLGSVAAAEDEDPKETDKNIKEEDVDHNLDNAFEAGVAETNEQMPTADDAILHPANTGNMELRHSTWHPLILAQVAIAGQHLHNGVALEDIEVHGEPSRPYMVCRWREYRHTPTATGPYVRPGGVGHIVSTSPHFEVGALSSQGTSVSKGSGAPKGKEPTPRERYFMEGLHKGKGVRK